MIIFKVVMVTWSVVQLLLITYAVMTVVLVRGIRGYDWWLVFSAVFAILTIAFTVRL